MYHSLVVIGGVTYGWGSNGWGELGIKSNNTKHLTPQRVFIQGFISQVALGNGFSMFLKSDYTLYASGANHNGHLGISTSAPLVSVPGKVHGIEGRVVQVACGNSHTLALLSDGSLYSWGHNSSGQLGISNISDPSQSNPTQIDSIGHEIVQIACGGYSSAVVTREGFAYCWGIIGGMKIFSPKRVAVSNVTKISCGTYHILALSRDGLFSWGGNESGQLGVGNNSTHYYPTNIPFFDTKRVIQIACGGFHSMALLSDGSLYSWGYNKNGQIGLGYSSNQVTIPTLTKGIQMQLLR